MSFDELAPTFRPNSEAVGDTRSDASANVNPDLIATVIDRWRSASASQRMRDFDVTERDQPVSVPIAPTHQAPVAPPRTDALRASILKKPLDPVSLGASSPVAGPSAPLPPRFR
jgi:hypothetical protein